MPKLPFNYLAYGKTDGSQKQGHAGRVDFETVYPLLDEGKDISQLPGNVVCNVTSVSQAAEQDILGKKLFLNALTEMIASEGGHTDAADLFEKVARWNVSQDNRTRDTNMDGSQVIVALHRFRKPAEWRVSGPPETTTSYGFQFRGPQARSFSTEAGFQGLVTAHYQIDVRPFELLAQMGARPEFQKRYLTQFFKMAEMAEHDYVHQLITHPTANASETPWHFPDEMNRYAYDDVPRKVSDIEKLALGTHAQACHWLFGEHLLQAPASTGSTREPKPDLTKAQEQALAIGRRRKQKVLDWAKETFTMLVEVQEMARADATPAQQAQVKEAVTYLAEIYAHRFFRVISPTDIDLAQSDIPSICDQLNLQMPRKRNMPQPDGHGIEGLRALCGTHMGDLYVNSHAFDQVKIITRVRDMNHFLTEMTHQMLTPAMFIDQVAQRGLPRMRENWEFSKRLENEKRAAFLEGPQNLR